MSGIMTGTCCHDDIYLQTCLGHVVIVTCALKQGKGSSDALGMSIQLSSEAELTLTPDCIAS